MLRIIAKLKWRTKLSGENTESFRCPAEPITFYLFDRLADAAGCGVAQACSD